MRWWWRKREAPARGGGDLPERAPEGAALPVWMEPEEYGQVVAIFEATAPRTVLEWGCGGSTRALLARAPWVERWFSVEHHPAWAEKVRAAIHDPRLDLRLVEPAEPEPPAGEPGSEAWRTRKAWWLRAERDPALLADYVAAPRRAGLRPDFVLVDGRARCFCIAEGFRLLRPGGVLVLHDAQRPEYAEALAALPRTVHLFPFHDGQVALARKPEGASWPES